MSDYNTYPSSHPDYTSDEPEREPAPPIYYRCLDCVWVGLSAGAVDHHYNQPTHRIILRDAPQFGVVSLGAGRR